MNAPTLPSRPLGLPPGKSRARPAAVVLTLALHSSLLACGSRSALTENHGSASENTGGSGGSESDSSGGTGNGNNNGGGPNGGSGGSLPDDCEGDDLNSGPGEWLNEMRLPPVEADGYSVSIPSLVTTRRGLHLAYVLSAVPGVTEEGAFTPGLVFSESVTPLGDPNPTFSFQLVDPAGSAGATIATDGNALVVAYHSQDGLKLATKESDGWNTELVDDSAAAPLGAPANALSSHCAFDKSGGVHILYSFSEGIRYAYKARNTWTFSPLSSFAASVRVEKLLVDLDGDNVVHAAWKEVDDDGAVLRYASLGLNWTVEEVLAPVDVDDFALQVAPNGQAHVAILQRSLDSPAVHYGRREENVWAFEPLSAIPDIDGFGYVALDLGADGSSHLLLSARISSYATNRSGTWEAEYIQLSAEDGAELALDASGAAHAVSRYFNYPNNTAPHYKTNQFVELDGVDQNCDGTDGLDADQDGLASRFTGGSDCDDTDEHVRECAISE